MPFQVGMIVSKSFYTSEHCLYVHIVVSRLKKHRVRREGIKKNNHARCYAWLAPATQLFMTTSKLFQPELYRNFQELRITFESVF